MDLLNFCDQLDAAANKTQHGYEPIKMTADVVRLMSRELRKLVMERQAVCGHSWEHDSLWPLEVACDFCGARQ